MFVQCEGFGWIPNDFFCEIGAFDMCTHRILGPLYCWEEEKNPVEMKEKKWKKRISKVIPFFFFEEILRVKV